MVRNRVYVIGSVVAFALVGIGCGEAPPIAIDRGHTSTVFGDAGPVDAGLTAAADSGFTWVDTGGYDAGWVYMNGDGGIEKMTLSEEGSAATTGKDLTSDPKVYQTEIKALAAGLATQKPPKVGKLTLELDAKLVQDSVMQLVDIGIRAGFNDISPVPIDKGAR